MTLQTRFTEDDLEELVLDWLGDGWKPLHGQDIAPVPASAGLGMSC